MQDKCFVLRLLTANCFVLSIDLRCVCLSVCVCSVVETHRIKKKQKKKAAPNSRPPTKAKWLKFLRKKSKKKNRRLPLYIYGFCWGIKCQWKWLENLKCCSSVSFQSIKMLALAIKLRRFAPSQRTYLLCDSHFKMKWNYRWALVARPHCRHCSALRFLWSSQGCKFRIWIVLSHKLCNAFRSLSASNHKFTILQWNGERDASGFHVSGIWLAEMKFPMVKIVFFWLLHLIYHQILYARSHWMDDSTFSPPPSSFKWTFPIKTNERIDGAKGAGFWGSRQIFVRRMGNIF